MAFARCLFLLSCAISCMFLHSVHCECSYTTLETALLRNRSNLENLMNYFFPTDHATSTVVDIFYMIRVKNYTASNSEMQAHVPQNETISIHVLSEVSQEAISDFQPSIRLHFRWVLSSINMFVEPEVLQVLSLNMFQMSNQSVYLLLELPSDCNISSVSEDTCNWDRTSDFIKGLYNLTSNMRSYAKRLHLNKSSNVELKQSENMGYSLFVIKADTNTISSPKYCALDQNFVTVKIILFVTVFVLGLFCCIGVPTILGAVYQRLYAKMDNSNSDWQFIVWGVAVVTCIASFVVAGTALWYIWRDYQLNRHIAFTHLSYATLYSAYIGGFILATALTMATFGWCLCQDVFAGDNTDLSKFPIPHVFLICFGFREEKYLRGTLVTVACFFVTLFLVLISFHGIFMILGIVAVPLVALPRATFYISVIVCLAAFVAFFLKFSNKSGCDNVCNCCRGGNANAEFERVDLCKYSVAVISALALFACVIMCGVLYYLLSRKVEDYQHGGSFLSILGSFLPSLLVVFATFCGRKLMHCLKGSETAGESNGESNERTRLLSQPEVRVSGNRKRSNKNSRKDKEGGENTQKAHLDDESDKGKTKDNTSGDMHEMDGTPQGQVHVTEAEVHEVDANVGSSSKSKVQDSSKDDQSPSSGNSSAGRNEGKTAVTTEGTSLDKIDANKQQHDNKKPSGHEPKGNEHPTGISPATQP